MPIQYPRSSFTSSARDLPSLSRSGDSWPSRPGSDGLNSTKNVPPAQRLLLRNRKVRVWEMLLRPGESYPLHGHHYPYLAVILESASLTLTNSEGRKRHLRAKTGDVIWKTPPDDHSVRNTGRTRFRVRLIELIG